MIILAGMMYYKCLLLYSLTELCADTAEGVTSEDAPARTHMSELPSLTTDGAGGGLDYGPAGASSR